MAVGRKQRRDERRQLVEQYFAEPDVDAALDLLELFELAWHDCYREITPTDDIVDDVLLLSRGDLAGLIQTVHLAITDWRDLRLNAAAIRGGA